MTTKAELLPMDSASKRQRILSVTVALNARTERSH